MSPENKKSWETHKEKHCKTLRGDGTENNVRD